VTKVSAVDVGIVLGVVAIVASIVVPTGLERLKRPRLEIIPSLWAPPRFVTWTFATVRVRNKPPKGLNWLFMRQPAQGCAVEIDYYLWDSNARFLTLPGRWSSVLEPLSYVPSPLAAELPAGSGSAGSVFAGSPVTGVGPPPTGFVGLPVSAGTASTFPVPPAGAGAASTSEDLTQPKFGIIYDPTRDPGQRDVAVSRDGEEVAVAILRDDEAFAFSTESYNHPSWGNPDWRLERTKTYRIVVRVRGSGIKIERKFRLEYLSNDVSEFRLTAVG
jgi:hypothetical protein